MNKRRVIALAAIAAVVVGLSACQTGRFATPGDSVPLDETDAGKALMHQQAVDALARWDAAYAAAKQPVFAPLGELGPSIVGIGPSENEKELLYSTDLTMDAGLRADIPDKTELQWASGATRPVAVVSAGAAFATMTAFLRSHCGGCSATGSAHVTAARMITVTIETVDGPVTAPAWEYTLAGHSARYVMPSVGAGEALIPPTAPWDSAHPPLGLSFDSVKSTSDGTRLTLGFTGSQGHSDKPCGEDYTPEVVAGTHAVVIVIHTQRYHGGAMGPNEACNLIGYHREAVVTLNPPLGNRVVLEGRVGQPVAVSKE
jgi:hypothetical protein